MRRLPSFAVLCAIAALAAGAADAGEESLQLKHARGSELAGSRCVICHSLDYIPMNAPVLDRAGWQKTIRKMVDKFGAPITDEEANAILDYLSTYYALPVSGSH